MRGTSLILAGLVGLGVAGATQAATIVVLPGDIGPGPNPAASGWHWNVANPTLDSSAQIVNGPATPPLNAGSLQQIMGPNPQGFVSLDSGNLYQGRRLADLQSVTFSHYEPSGNTGEQIVVLRYDQDGDLNTANNNSLDQGRIWLQPSAANGGAGSPEDVWNTVTFDKSSVEWEISGNAGPGSLVGTRSLDQIVAAYPNAVLVGNTGAAGVDNSYKSTFRIAPTSGFGPQISYIDNLQFVWDVDPSAEVSLETDIYDFELVAPPIPEPASLGLLAVGAGLALLRRKRA